jgi:hypothetical protein
MFTAAAYLEFRRVAEVEKCLIACGRAPMDEGEKPLLVEGAQDADGTPGAVGVQGPAGDPGTPEVTGPGGYVQLGNTIQQWGTSTADAVGVTVTFPVAWCTTVARTSKSLARTHVPVDEPFRVLGEILIGIEGAVQHLVGDALRHVARPALGSVEGYYAESVAVLAREEVPYDRLAIRLGGVRLDVGFAERAEVVDHQVDAWG